MLRDDQGMKQETSNHELLVQYLLGELSEPEQMRLEQQYFNDDDLFEQMLVIEGELMDAYLRDELSERERQRFEAHFMASPRLRRKVEIAKALVTYATESSAVTGAAEKPGPLVWWQSLRDRLGEKNRAIRLAMAAAALVIIAGGAWLIVESVRLRNQVEQIQAERAEALRREQELEQRLAEQGARNDQLADELQRERSQRELLEQERTTQQHSTLSAITFMLTPDLVRGAGETKRLIIPQRADLVRLQIVADQNDYKSYRAVLETVDGKRIWSSGLLQARSNRFGKLVTLRLPARLFTRGDYILTFSGLNDGGLENVGEYYFNVVKR
jgi:hypothetical protein